LAAKALDDYRRAQTARATAEQAALAVHLRPQIESDAGGFAIGASPTTAKVTVVDFFDYHCGACKRATDDVLTLAETHRDVRFVFKELPVLSDESHLAARAALAARQQGRYMEFHKALMTSPGLFTDERLFAIAGKVGLDVARLRKDMAMPTIDREIEATASLAKSLRIEGTPAFFVNGEVMRGRDKQRLTEMIEQARDPRSN
jgi:protein-disulfide isomerase